MSIYEENNVKNNLTPVSRVIFRALMEACVAKEEKENAMEFLLEAEELWQHKKTAQEYKHAGAYFLARTYQRLAKEKIIATDGRVLAGGALIDGKRLNGFLCRPRGFAPINYQQSKTIMALAFQPITHREGQNK